MNKKMLKFISEINKSLEKYRGFYGEIILPYQETLDLKNFIMHTYEPQGYVFTLYNKSERGDKEITMGFKLEKPEEKPWEYMI